MPQNTSVSPVLTRTHFTELRSKHSPPETPSRQEPNPGVMAMPVQETGTSEALSQRAVTQVEAVPGLDTVTQEIQYIKNIVLTGIGAESIIAVEDVMSQFLSTDYVDLKAMLEPVDKGLRQQTAFWMMAMAYINQNDKLPEKAFLSLLNDDANAWMDDFYTSWRSQKIAQVSSAFIPAAKTPKDQFYAYAIIALFGSGEIKNAQSLIIHIENSPKLKASIGAYLHIEALLRGISEFGHKAAHNVMATWNLAQYKDFQAIVDKVKPYEQQQTALWLLAIAYVHTEKKMPGNDLLELLLDQKNSWFDNFYAGWSMRTFSRLSLPFRPTKARGIDRLKVYTLMTSLAQNNIAGAEETLSLFEDRTALRIIMQRHLEIAKTRLAQAK